MSKQPLNMPQQRTGNVPKKNNPAGLYVLGTLYPHMTGGMEIFNYYFLNYQLNENNSTIYYLGGQPLTNNKGHFVRLKKIWPARIFYPMQFFLAVRKLRKKVQFAYISFAEQSWVISYSQSLVLRFFKIPYTITIHWGKDPEWKFRYPFLQFFRKAHSIVGVSEAICKSYGKVIGRNDLIYIPPLIPFMVSAASKEDAKHKLGIPQAKRILLFVGSLKGMKNPDKILLALKHLGTDFLKANHLILILVGSGEMEGTLKVIVESNGLSSFVRFEGLVTRDVIPDYYRAADCYMISSDYEGTSVSLLEAMFNQLPIIASDAPGIKTMLKDRHNALLYLTTDEAQMADCIRKMITDRTLAAGLGQNAKIDFLNRYSYDSMMTKYCEVFLSAAC